jgi:RNA polymerase sigma-70 factor (ECF subfamily)
LTSYLPSDSSRDEALMRRVQSGEREAFRELMRRWQAPLFRFFAVVGLDRHDCEDCVQETFLRLFAYRERYRPRGSGLRAFLFRIARNVSIDSFRRARNRRGWVSVDALAADPASEDRCSLWNDRFDLETALRDLPARLRVVVALNLFEGLSYRETAEALDLPTGTVKSRMHHALLRLRAVLRPELEV